MRSHDKSKCKKKLKKDVVIEKGKVDFTVCEKQS